MYIGDFLGRREIYSPNKLAIIDAGKNPELRLTYREWNRRVNRFANWLRHEAGVAYRDRVAILARDGIEHLDLIYACGKMGAIHTALNWRLHWRELVGLVEETTPKVLLYSDDFKGTVADVESATRSTQYAIRHYLHIEGDGIPGLHFPVRRDSQGARARVRNPGHRGHPVPAQRRRRRLGEDQEERVPHQPSEIRRRSWRTSGWKNSSRDSAA